MLINKKKTTLQIFVLINVKISESMTHVLLNAFCVSGVQFFDEECEVINNYCMSQMSFLKYI